LATIDGYRLLLWLLDIGFGYSLLSMAIDYFDLQFLEFGFGFSKVKY
jgi:hypothetical protein